ncbi:MAG: hypothetical protein HY907_06195 [Deltaproteobacteria bacterium]|nr:hypothetical protein [Deltaproteobacteria bacterium]
MRTAIVVVVVLLASGSCCSHPGPGSCPSCPACPQAGTEAGAAATPATFTDNQGTAVTFELGARAFADRIVSAEPGDPARTAAGWTDPAAALAVPDYHGEHDEPPTAVTLGCGGVLVVEFTDNGLVDGPGADLHVFECGPDVEAMHIAISVDGTSWTEVGDVRGQPAQVDLAAVAAPDVSYRFVRITDLRDSCSSTFPGADIDAVGAIHAVAL